MGIQVEVALEMVKYYLTTPASANPIRAVHEDKRNDRDVELRLDGQPIVLQIMQ